MPNSSADVAGLRDHEPVHRLHQRELGLAVPAAGRPHRRGDPLRARQAGDPALVPERLGGDPLGLRPHLGAGPDLVADQPPVEAGHLFPALVGRDVHVARDLAPARHAGLGDHARDVLRAPAVLHHAARERPLRVGDPLGPVRVDGAGLRHEQHVLEPRLAGRLVHEGEVAEVVGEQVLAGHVLHPPGHLQHVAGGERREGERPRGGVEVEPVPGLAGAPLALLVRLDHRPVRPEDARPLHPHLLPVGRPGERLAAVRVGAARREHLHHRLREGRGEAGGEHPGDLEVAEHQRVLVGRGRRRGRGQRRGVEEVGPLERLAGRLEAPRQRLELRALRLELEGPLQIGLRVARAPGREARPAAPLPGVRLVGRERQRGGVGRLGVVGPAVGGEEIGEPQPQPGVGRVEPQRLGEQRLRPRHVAALGEELGQGRARLRVVEAEREEGAEPGGALLGPPQPAGGAGGGADRRGHGREGGGGLLRRAARRAPRARRG